MGHKRTIWDIDGYWLILRTVADPKCSRGNKNLSGKKTIKNLHPDEPWTCSFPPWAQAGNTPPAAVELAYQSGLISRLGYAKPTRFLFIPIHSLAV